jgi:HlyD family secretion protein
MANRHMSRPPSPSVSVPPSQELAQVCGRPPRLPGGSGEAGNLRTAEQTTRGSACGQAASLLIVAALLLLLFACSNKEAEQEPLVTVQVAQARIAPIASKIEAQAIIYPIRQAAIAPKISAPVKKFYVERGTHVKAGQLLAELENRDLVAAEIDNRGAFEQAQAAYETAVRGNVPEEIRKAELDAKAAKQQMDAQQKIYENRQRLFAQGATPRKDVEDALVAYTQAKNAYEIAAQHLEALKSFGREQELKAAEGQLTSAKGKYEVARAQLSYSEIRSPIDGVVTDRPLYAGEMATSGSPLITVMDTSQIVARAHITPPEAAALHLGDPASIFMSAGPTGGSPAGNENEVRGKVTLVSPALDPNSATVEVWVQAPNPHGQLRPGSSARVTITAQTLENALVVPASAILAASDGTTTVMVVGDDGRAHQRAVKTGVRDGDSVQITDGLKPGETVVSVGAYGLPDNTRVQVGQPQHGKESKEK